jgi:hypothetical protein
MNGSPLTRTGPAFGRAIHGSAVKQSDYNGRAGKNNRSARWATVADGGRRHPSSDLSAIARHEWEDRQEEMNRAGGEKGAQTE